MDDMIGEFVTETIESLATLDLELVRLEQNPQDAAILSAIFRLMHTVKGTCGFLGLHRLGKMAHAAESILGKFRGGKLQVTPQAVTLILQSVDRIKNIVDAIAVSGIEPEGDDSALADSLNRFAEGNAGAEVKPNGKANSIANHEPARDMASFFKGNDDLEELIRQAQEVERKTAARPEAETAVKNPQAAEERTGFQLKESGVAGNQTIRVSIDILEKMMQAVGELVLSRNQLMQIARMDANQQFLPPLQQLSHITTELQESVMKTRMQPVGIAWSKFPRLVRDLSLELGKKIELKMTGEETELDRQLLEAIKDPLTHMVRNACDHGIETPDSRAASGKPEVGTVALNARHDGGHIVIDISDDGKGIDIERVKEKARAGGLATSAELAAMSEGQMLRFIFHPGFSTADKVTAVSGRGVGMDVVRTNIEKMGGAIDLSSASGKGSKISIRIPLTLAIVSVLIVETSKERFAIPQANIRELLQVGDSLPLRLERINNASVLRLREELLPVMTLSGILRLPVRKRAKGEPDFVVVCSAGGRDFGLVVDCIHNIEEIVVKPVSRAIKSVPLFAGNTILGDGSVIMILDPAGLAREMGEIKLCRQEAESRNVVAATDKMTNFLLFRNGKGAPNAVPLELVWRLEEISANRIERASGFPVVQYSGQLMRLLGSGFTLPEKGIIRVIVFCYDDKMVGLPVREILDIVRAPFNLQLTSQAKGYLGSMVIAGNACDIVDVSCLIDTAGGYGEPAKEAEKVLLVDDSPFFLKMTVPFLISAGYRVTAVENGIEALAALEQSREPFDIIVTDIQMPDMDGFRFAEACHAFPKSASIPIIGYTATVDHDTLRKSRHAGMLACVAKNNRPELLEAMMKSRTNHVSDGAGV